MEVIKVIRWPLIIFLVGFLIRLAGALWKIRHWPGADKLITIGFIICGIAVIWGIIILLTIKNRQNK